MGNEQSYERFKWTLLDEARFHHSLGIAYYWAKRAFPGREDEFDGLVQQTLLELMDEGLIFFHWGGWDDGCDLDPYTAEGATRAEVEAELRRGGNAEPTARTVWFKSTDAGEARLTSVPAEVLLGYEDDRKSQAFLARHPEYHERVEEWLNASGRWVREGGRRPKPPSASYRDWPFPKRRWTLLDSLPGSRLGNILGRLSEVGARLRKFPIR